MSQANPTTASKRMLWTFAVASAAVFMAALDNLVVTMALPSIQRDLGAGLDELEWTVNAYTLTFAVLLLTAAGAAPAGLYVAAALLGALLVGESVASCIAQRRAGAALAPADDLEEDAA